MLLVFVVFGVYEYVGDLTNNNRFVLKGTELGSF